MQLGICLILRPVFNALADELFFPNSDRGNRIISFLWSSSLNIIIWIYQAVQPSYLLLIVSDLAYTSANYAKLGMSRRFQNLLAYISECK